MPTESVTVQLQSNQLLKPVNRHLRVCGNDGSIPADVPSVPAALIWAQRSSVSTDKVRLLTRSAEEPHRLHACDGICCWEDYSQSDSSAEVLTEE